MFLLFEWASIGSLFSSHHFSISSRFRDVLLVHSHDSAFHGHEIKLFVFGSCVKMNASTRKKYSLCLFLYLKFLEDETTSPWLLYRRSHECVLINHWLSRVHASTKRFKAFFKTAHTRGSTQSRLTARTLEDKWPHKDNRGPHGVLEKRWPPMTSRGKRQSWGAGSPDVRVLLTDDWACVEQSDKNCNTFGWCVAQIYFLNIIARSSDRAYIQYTSHDQLIYARKLALTVKLVLASGSAQRRRVYKLMAMARLNERMKWVEVLDWAGTFMNRTEGGRALSRWQLSVRV